MCKCQNCKTDYKVDFNIPDDLWLKINSQKEFKLLCPSCIGKKIELVSDYKAFKLVKL